MLPIYPYNVEEKKKAVNIFKSQKTTFKARKIKSIVI